MSNGCICCTLRDDLLKEVGKLAKENCFDYLLIESTGISEPMPVAETFTSLDDADLSIDQIDFADILIINKINRMTTEDVGVSGRSWPL